MLSGAAKVLRFIPRALQVIEDFGRAEQEADRVLEAVGRAKNEVGAERRAAPEPCNSFTGDTRVVMADGTGKPIDQVHVGDKITNGQAGELAGGGDQQHVVTAVHVTYTDRDYTDVTVDTGHGAGTVTGTAGHLYWDATTGQWTPAHALRVGERVQTGNGATVSITGVRDYTATMVTYNLTISQLHTYYVDAGTAPVLVHNCGEGAKSADGVAEGIGEARTYVDLTKGGSIRNVGTNTTHDEFADNLLSGGWTSQTSKDGSAQIFQKDGAKYVLRNQAANYDGWTADFTPAGAQRAMMKIRLGYAP